MIWSGVFAFPVSLSHKTLKVRDQGMALKVSTHWMVAALLVRDAVGLGSRGGGRRRGVDRHARLGE